MMFGFIRRALPIALVTGGLVLSAKTGGKAIDLVADLSKSVLTRTELSSIAKAFFATYQESEPPVRDSDAWARFLKDALTSRGGRDTSKDLWDTPFTLEALGGNKFRVRSAGPNQGEDYACDADHKGGGLGDPEVLLARFGLSDAQVDPETGEEFLVGDDDLCIDVDFTQ